MPNVKKVKDSFVEYLKKLRAMDGVSEDMADEALELAENVSDALCEDEEADVLEITKDGKCSDEEKEEKLVEKVTDGVLRALRAAGVTTDSSMKALDEFEKEFEEKETEKVNDESVTVSSNLDESSEKESTADAATLLKTLKPMIAAIPNAKERKKAADALASMLRGSAAKKTASDYTGLMSAVQHNKAQDAKSADKAVSDEDFGMMLAKKFNPHYKEV